jgi:hypothetical protein
MPPIPCLPEDAEPPRCVNVTPAAGVPAVRFRFVFTDELPLPPDALALDFRPERVPALGFADAFVLDDAGTFFDGFMVMAMPDRGAEPFALVFGAVAVEPDLAFALDRWPAATAAVGIARAATNPTTIMNLFMSVSLLGAFLGRCQLKLRPGGGSCPDDVGHRLEGRMSR